MATYTGASGATYRCDGRKVHVRYSTGSHVTMTFDTAAQAKAYASHHGKPTRAGKR